MSCTKSCSACIGQRACVLKVTTRSPGPMAPFPIWMVSLRCVDPAGAGTQVSYFLTTKANGCYEIIMFSSTGTVVQPSVWSTCHVLKSWT